MDFGNNKMNLKKTILTALAIKVSIGIIAFLNFQYA